MPDRGRGNPWRLEKNMAIKDDGFSTFTVEDTINNAVSIPHAILHNLSSGTPQAGIGVGERYYVEGLGGDAVACHTEVVLDVVTSGAEYGHVDEKVVQNGSLVTAYSVYPEGIVSSKAVHGVGGIDGYVVKYNTTTAVTVAAGSCEANGKRYTLAADASHSMTSLAAGFDHHYIYIDDDASTAPTAVIIDATTEPAWSDSKRGWYNGNDRCIGSVVSPAAAATILYFNASESGNNVEYFYGTDLLPACATSLNPSGAWQTPNTNESSVLCPVNSKLLHGTVYFQDTGSSCRFYAASSEMAAVNAVGNSDVTFYAEVLARRSFTVSLGASRNIKITGENDDDNVLGVVVQGFLTDR
jgi:hypothetical protein